MVLAPKNTKSKKGAPQKSSKPAVEKAVEEDQESGTEATVPNNESAE